MQRITASIITIGDELLIGQVIDTNSAWIGQQLNKIGVWVQSRVAVGDVWSDIWQALDQESEKSDVIIITGGLGPTADDITKPLLTAYFQGKLVVDHATLENVQKIFARFNRPMLDANNKQAEVPDVCTVMLNSRGTAPGMQFEKGGKLYFSMPGVPYEMQGMVESAVLPALQKKYSLIPIQHRSLTTIGLGESFLAERLRNFESNLPSSIKLAYLPGAQLVRLRLTEQTSTEEGSQMDTKFNELKALATDIMLTDEDISVAEAISQLLLKHHKTLTAAESCTGGYLAELLTSIPGASGFYPGSVVSYDNAIKEQLLQVPIEILEQHGAVSEAVVQFMAKNVRKIMHADYAIAVSGILGPTGGSAEKPVGTVWIAVASEKGLKTQLFNFRYDRIRNREATANNAFNLLRQLIQAEN